MTRQCVVNIENVAIYHGDVTDFYQEWMTPDVIVSDGGYGINGFNGDSKSPADLQSWYRPHIQFWSRFARPGATLWFWNTEIGWASVHPLLDASGWEYVGCNIWNKGIQHIAGNCNLSTIRRFPVVTEVCVQYVRRAEIDSNGQRLSLKAWMRNEWTRTGLSLSKANDACGTANAASRKYLTQDLAWYAPPPNIFIRMVAYANAYGNPDGRPYFSLNGRQPATEDEYMKLFPVFKGKYGMTNVWDHRPLHSSERLRDSITRKSIHPNQKPIALMRMIIESSSNPGDVIWEPFGGLCTAGLAALLTSRTAYCAEIDDSIYRLAVARMNAYAQASEQASS